GLGVWTPSSDLDCLYIGHASSRTFFALAAQRLRRAAAAGEAVRTLRRVEARTGTMLELEVEGVRVDLQYCAAPGVAARWPAALGYITNPAGGVGGEEPAGDRRDRDPFFALPTQTLGKLKALRDMHYLRATLPDRAVFRAAFRLVKAWA